MDAMGSYTLSSRTLFNAYLPTDELSIMPDCVGTEPLTGTSSTSLANASTKIYRIDLIHHEMSAPVPTIKEDPFACFEGEGDDSQRNRREGTEPAKDRTNNVDPLDDRRQVVVTRDPLCGVLRYHRGTERSLLVHVENDIKRLDHKESLALEVLKSIDKYSLERHWMMHCGPIKGKTLQDFLKECVAARDQPEREPDSKLIVVEIGTYCGYSSIVLAKALRDDIMDSAGPVDFHIFTVEANAECVAVATRLIELAGMEESITVILNEDLTPKSNDLIKALRRKIRERFQNPTKFFIDFLFLDHDKEQYLIDLQALEGSGLIRKGTYVAADNVIFAHITDYRDYLEGLAQSGVVHNRMVELDLEYSEPDLHDKSEDVRDGIELTIYLEDPPLGYDS